VAASVKLMENEYSIEPVGVQFAVVDPWGEQVGTYPTEEAAKQDIERCKKDDAMLLVDNAVEAHMEKFGIDRETASYWINSALGGV
jgi:hypothetical protein